MSLIARTSPVQGASSTSTSSSTAHSLPVPSSVAEKNRSRSPSRTPSSALRSASADQCDSISFWPSIFGGLKSPLPSSSSSPPAPRTPPWFSKLHSLFLHTTPQSDLSTPDFETVYPRIFVIEYLFSVSMVTYIYVYAFYTLRMFCSNNVKQYSKDLLTPYRLLSHYGATGYDGIVDTQWTAFSNQFPLMMKIFSSIALITLLCRCASAASMVGTSSSSQKGSTSPSFNNDGVPSIVADDDSLNNNMSRTTLMKRCIGYKLLSNPHTSAAWRVVCKIAGRPGSLPAFYAIAGVIFLGIAHGPYCVLPLLIITANYIVFTRLQRVCPYWMLMGIMWVTHVALLYIISVTNGFEQTYWVQQLFTTPKASVVDSKKIERIPLWNSAMRWSVAFRMTTLRLIAFNYDLWEATHAASRARERATVKHDTTCVECAQLRQQNAASLPAEASRCYKYRTEYSRDVADYSFLNYVAYVLFPPLYIAGPMSSFNAFVSHMRVPSTSMPPWKMLEYAFSILCTYVMTVVLLHFIHIPALAKHAYLIARMTFVEQSHYFFFSLAYLWLKFNFLWKSSRLFALLSGIEAPEDMRRCFNAAFTVREFWRDWHASFNLWVVRYMYIPMGGRSRVALSVLPIFLFIAIWHDPILHLVKWAVCIALMFVVELVVSGYFEKVVAAFRREMADAAQSSTANKLNETATADDEGVELPPRRHLSRRLAALAVRFTNPINRAWSYRALRVLGGIGSISGLIFANLVGFSMQNEHSQMGKAGPADKSLEADTAFVRTLRQITPLFFLGYFFYLYCTVSINLLTRDAEANQMRSLKKQYGLE